MIPRHRTGLVTLLAAACTCSTLGAQANVPTARGLLTLQAVIDTTLAGSTQIRNDRARVDSYRGLLLARSAPFDVQVHSAVGQAHGNEQVTAATFLAQQATSYAIAISRQFRSGVSLTPSVEVTKSQLVRGGAPATGLASANLGIAVPLLYDRGGAVSAIGETVGQLDLQTALATLKNTVVSSVNSTVGFYWAYAAAVARLEAQRQAEARAQRLLDETTMLVDRQERAVADLQPLRGNAAAKRGARILAEQAVSEARVQLGAAMGLDDAAAVAALPAPATPFPEPAAGARPLAESFDRLADTARGRRADLVAQRVSIRAWELELRQVQSAALPRLDLVVTLGYQGVTQGPGLSHLIAPLYRNVPGLNANVQLRYDVSVANSAARGRVVQEQASLAQQRVSLRDVERAVGTDVQTAVLAVDRSVGALLESERAVDLFRASVDNEKRKLQLGMNTLFDVLNAEDALTNAELTAINNRRAYAAALSTLRAATGTLVDTHTDRPRVDAAHLLVTP